MQHCARCRAEFKQPGKREHGNGQRTGTTHLCEVCRLNKNPNRAKRDKHGFTPRDYRTIDMVMDGKLNKQIAFTLGISEYSVKTYLQRIMQRLGVHNRVQLAVWRCRHL